MRIKKGWIYPEILVPELGKSVFDWQDSVLDRDLTSPPAGPAIGARYLIASSGASGEWTGKENQIAAYYGPDWNYNVPSEGFCLRVEDEDILVVYDGSAWGSLGGAVGDIKLPDGSAASPSLSFLTDPNTGIYTSGADIFDIAASGLQHLSIDGGNQWLNVHRGSVRLPNNTLFTDTADGTVSISNLAGATSSGRLLIGDGSVATPSLAFKSDDDGGGTGICRSAANSIGLIANGTEQLRVNITGIVAYNGMDSRGRIFNNSVALNLGAAYTPVKGGVTGSVAIGKDAGGISLETEGVIYSIEDVILSVDKLIYNTVANGGIQFANASQTVRAPFLLTGSSGNYITLAELADRTTDFAFPQQTNPTLAIQSADATKIGQRLALAYDGAWADHPVTDIAPHDVHLLGANAYQQATGANQTGGDVNIAAGIGTRQCTIVDYTGLATDTVTVTIDGDLTPDVLTEGSEWTAATSNDATATSLAAAINALTGLSATATGAVVDVVPDSKTKTVTLATSGGADLTLTQGTDGSVAIHTSHNALVVTPTLVAFGGTTASYPGLKRTSGDLWLRRADDSADANLYAWSFYGTGSLRAGATEEIYFNGRTKWTSSGNGIWEMGINAGTQGVRFDAATTVDVLHLTDESNNNLGVRVGHLKIEEITTPGAVANVGAIYTKTDNKLYFQDGAGSEKEIVSADAFHAMMHDTDNTDAFVINDTALFHVYHTNGLASANLNGWTFDAGGAGTSVAIDSVADGGGGEITVTTNVAHGLAAGDIISQTNMSVAAYDGLFVVESVGSTTAYNVTAVWSATATGTMDQAATLTASTGSASDYIISWTASATSAVNNETFDWEVLNNAAVVVGSKMRRKFGTAADFGVMGGSVIATIAAGDKLSFALANTDSGGNVTIRNFTLIVHRL